MSISVYLFNAPNYSSVEHRRKASGYCTVTGYCSVTYGVLEGLYDLGFEVVCANEGLCARAIGPFDPSCDLYLVQRDPQSDTAGVLRLLERHGCLGRTALLDSLDHRFGIDSFWIESDARYFKKENEPGWVATTLLHCIQNRYLPETYPEPQDLVFSAFKLSTHPERAAVRRLLERGPWPCEFGPVVDPAGSRHPLADLVGGHHHPAFYRRLNECKVAVNVRGGARDCYRYWEIAASHAVLVSFPVEEELHGFPNPPTPGVHYVPYRSIEEVNDAVAEAFDRYQELHDAQREFFLCNHRSRNRAATVLRCMGLTEAAAAAGCAEAVG